MVKGSCFCGELQYEFTGEPVDYVACHCIPCRKTTGTDRSLNLIIPKTAIKTTSGSLKTAGRAGDSGKPVRYHQCENCSNIIYVTADAMSEIVILKLGTIDDNDFVNGLGLPKKEIYCKNNWTWQPAIEGASQAQGAS